MRGGFRGCPQGASLKRLPFTVIGGFFTLVSRPGSRPLQGVSAIAPYEIGY
jgi:hypothetical protein